MLTESVTKTEFSNRSAAENYYHSLLMTGVKNLKLWWIHGKGGCVEFES